MLIHSRSTKKTVVVIVVKTFGVLLGTMMLGACSNSLLTASNPFNDGHQKIDREYYVGQGHEFGERSRKTLQTAFKAAAQKDFEAFMATASDPYVQHSPDLPDGWKPVWDLLADRPEGFSSTTMQWMGKAGFLDSGDFLVMLREVNRADGTPPSKIVDLLRFDEEGKYAEHWDIRQPLSEATASGRSETAAADEFEDKPVNYDEETEKKNAKVVVRFLNQAFNLGQLDEALDELVYEGYVQHNPFIADGVDAVKQVFAEGKIPALHYDIKYVLPQNDLVVVYSKVTSSQGTSAVVDILRVRDGKLVEHWDVVQAVPSEDDMPHNNGMF